MAITSIDHVCRDPQELAAEPLRGRAAQKAQVKERFTHVEPETPAVESRTERATPAAVTAAATASTQVRPGTPTHLGRVPDEITGHQALNRKLSRISAKIDQLLKSPDLAAENRADLVKLRDKFPGRLEHRVESLETRRLSDEQVARRVGRTIDRLDTRVRGLVAETRVDRAVARANEKIDAALGTRDLGAEHQAALEDLRTTFIAATDDLSAGLRFAKSVTAGDARSNLKAAAKALSDGAREVLFEDRVDKLTDRAHHRIDRLLEHELLDAADKSDIQTALAAFDVRVAEIAAAAQGADRAGIKEAKGALNQAVRDLVASAKGELRQARADHRAGPAASPAEPTSAPDTARTTPPETEETAPAVAATVNASVTASASGASGASLAEVTNLLDSLLATFRDVFEQFAALDPERFEIDFSLHASSEGVTFSFVSAYEGVLGGNEAHTLDSVA